MIPFTAKWFQQRKDVNTWIRVYSYTEDDWFYQSTDARGFHKGNIGRNFTLTVNLYENVLGNRKVELNSLNNMSMHTYSKWSEKHKELVEPWLNNIAIIGIPSYANAMENIQSQLLTD